MEELDWVVDGSEHAAQLTALRKELVSTSVSQSAFSIARLFELIPLSSPQLEEALKREPIAFEGGRATNTGPSRLEMQFHDAALGRLTLIIPEELNAAYTVQADAEEIQFEFDEPFPELHLPKITENGWNRSEYQSVDSISIEESHISYRLRDVVTPEKVLRLTVQISETFALKEGAKALFEVNLCGDVDGDGDEYIICRANSSRACIPFKGSSCPISYPNMVASGFSSISDANRWLDQNCPIGTC